MGNTSEVVHAAASQAVSSVSWLHIVMEKSSVPVLAVSWTVLAGAFCYFRTSFKTVDGVRVWARRVALERGLKVSTRYAPTAPYQVDRTQQSLQPAVAGFALSGSLGWLLLVVYQVRLMAVETRDSVSDLLMREAFLLLFIAALLGLIVVVVSAFYEFPNRDEDERQSLLLERELLMFVRREHDRVSDLGPLAGASSPSTGEHMLPFLQASAAANDNAMELTPSTQLAKIAGRSPKQFHPVVYEQMSACLYQFDPIRVFSTEEGCVNHLRKQLELACKYEDRNVDILALCVDKTLGADYVDRYWRETLDAAKAGVYISRIFAYEPETYDEMRAIAQVQSGAGVNAYLIARAALVALLSPIYRPGVHGFTVIRGVKSADHVVLHSGTGDNVRAAAYDSQLLVDKLASLHATIRKSKDAKRTRGERSERGLDGTKTPILLRTRGGTLEAERLDYDVTPGSSSMSVAVRTPVPQSAPLACNEQVIVSADKLHLSDRPMRVTHLHCVNGIVCRRREHTTCLRAGDGQFFVGLNSVA